MQWCLPLRRQQAGTLAVDAAAETGCKAGISKTIVISAEKMRCTLTHTLNRLHEHSPARQVGATVFGLAWQFAGTLVAYKI